MQDQEMPKEILGTEICKICLGIHKRLEVVTQCLLKSEYGGVYMKGKKTGLYKVAVDLHFGSTLSTLLEGLGEHQLAHPVDTIFAALDSKMVALAILITAE